MIPLLLAVGLVLTDGRVVEGTDVRRRDATYQLTLASGEVLSLPEALVREIRLTDDAPKPEAPTAIRPGSRLSARCITASPGLRITVS